MRRTAPVALILATLLAAGAFTTGGAEPAELKKLFPKEAEVLVERDGLARLPLPAEVLAACRPDLSDLRLFDLDGLEVPFLLDAGREEKEAIEIIQSVDPPVLEAARDEIRREDGPPLRRETFELEVPDVPPRAGNWVLTAEIGLEGFVARLQVEGIGANGEATALVTDGSLFRLRGMRRMAKLRVPLPPFEANRLRVAVETELGSWLQPVFRLESAHQLGRGMQIAVPLELLSSRSGEGRTVIELSRPRGIVPDLLRVETVTGTFDRKIEIRDQGPGSSAQPLGSGRVFRVEGLVPIGERDVTLAPARGDRLRIEIDDGDSPPLAEPAFAAVIRRPALIFSVPSGRPGEGTGRLRFGGGRAHRPRYDLSGLLPPTATGERAEAVARLHDPEAVGPARLGEIGANPAYDGTPALAFAMHPGAEIDRRVFSHVRPLKVPAASEGLSRLRLEPADLAVLTGGLSDLRVADHDSRQWPYLLERWMTADFVPMEVESPESHGGTSVYSLRPPVSPLRLDRLLLETDTEFFNRAFHLEADVTDESDERTLVRGRLTRPISDPRAVSIQVSPTRVESLRLVIEDGDDAPLAFRSVKARVLLPELYLTAPEGDYALLLGAPDKDAPRYELERIRDVVLAVRAEPITVGDLAENPDFSLRARLRGGSLHRTILLWGVLILAVVVLGFMTLRLARRESAES
jgi:hypothetical protein